MQNLPNDLKKIEERIAKINSQRQKKLDKKVSDNSFVRFSQVGLRVGAELLSGVLIGAGIGYAFDAWLNTKPLGLIVFLFLGGAAGVLNVYKFAKSQEEKEE